MRNLTKIEALICLLCVLFFSFAAGWFLRGERDAEPLRVETQRTLAVSVTSFPSPTPRAPAEKININTATAGQLEALPGIGAKRAADIVADRASNGPFQSPEDLMRVKGIGEETLAGLIDYITVSEGDAS